MHTAQRFLTPVPVSCSRQSRPTGAGAPLFEPPMLTLRPPVPPRLCMNSFGARRSSADASAPPISVEIPFVFDTLGLGTEPLLGPDPPITRDSDA